MTKDIPWKQAVLTVDQFNRDDLRDIFKTADGFLTYDNGTYSHKTLGGKILANLFYEPSTRTSSSFHAAMLKLGGSVIPINEVNYSSVTKGETLEDTIRTLECYADVIVLRHTDTDAAQRAAGVSRKPIINAGNGDGEHPTQALLDLFTIFKEHGKFDGLTVTFLGDLKYGRTVHSLVKLLRLFDVKIRFVSPNSLRIPSEYYQNGDQESTTLDGLVDDTDILYVTRVQKERIPDGVTIDSSYMVTAQHMKDAPSDMVLMHPLPRLGEIPTEFDNDPRAAYFRQMKYGLYVRMALLAYMLVDF